MTVLFGHPTGNPNSFNAALAHFEAGRLEAMCIPWMPSRWMASLLDAIGAINPLMQRLGRRHFAGLECSPKLQDRLGESRRLVLRALGKENEALAYQANDWLMEIMARECRRPAVTAVHSFEDCSLKQFEQASRLGKPCIYDMPIGYYPAWESTLTGLMESYQDWLPSAGLPSSRFVRPKQKREEMKLANLILAPSGFVASTIHEYHPEKMVALAPYGVDAAAWPMRADRRVNDGTMTFLFVGQCSLRKGIPLLLKAWEAAGLRDARLLMVGAWHLAREKLIQLPRGVTWRRPVSRDDLRDIYGSADTFVFPSYFEGRALVVLEAMASGLPVVTTTASGADDLLDERCARTVSPGALDELVESLRWFSSNRDCLPAMGRAARARAEDATWARYRQRVSEAVASFV